MKRAFLLAALAAASQSPAHAFLKGGIEQTLGSRNYRGTYLYGDFGDAFHVKPSLNIYRSDTSSGTFKTFAARAAYDKTAWGVGATLGGTATTNDYSNRFIGFDGTLTLTPGTGPKSRLTDKDRAPAGMGLARVDVGGGLKFIRHTDRLEAVPGRGGVRRRPAAVSVNQTDVTLNAGAEVLMTAASVEITRSSYSRDLEAMAARATQTEQLSGVAAMVEGFPKTSSYLRFELNAFPMATPYVSFNRTTYMLSQAPSNAFAAGAYVGLQILELKLELERVTQSGTSGRTYVTLGGAVRF